MIDTSLIYDIFEEGKRLAACEYLEYWFDLGSLRDLTEETRWSLEFFSGLEKGRGDSVEDDRSSLRVIDAGT